MQTPTSLFQWMARSKVLKPARKVFLKFINASVAARRGVITYYDAPEHAKVYDLIQQIRGEVPMLLSHQEACQIYEMVQKVRNIPGDIAELGVYMGASVKLICEAEQDKTVWAFDTFEGLPETKEIDGPFFRKGDFALTEAKDNLYENVRKYLRRYKNANIIKGLFPQSAADFEKKRFSFVHLDADIYVSTLAGLQFFYPRLNKGGILISHDYGPSAPGVLKAFSEFFRDKPETILEIYPSKQCLVIKL